MVDSYSRRGRVFANGNWSIWLAIAFILVMLSFRSVDIFSGTLPDNDDLLRLQQVRDLMAGQNWFDVDQARMLTPEGGEMHWSRLPDIFLSAVIFVARPFIGQSHAESLAAVLWPLTLLCWTLIAFTSALQRLGVKRAGQLAALVFFATSTAIYNFWPGRIDHHNFVVALTITAFAALLSPRLSARSGIVAAACIAAMISVAIESLPYAGGLILALGLFWIIRGHLEATRLAAFGLALSGFALVFYFGDAPGFGAVRAVCDAYGNAHLAGLISGGCLLAGLGMFGGALDSWPKRLSAGVGAGGLTIVIGVLVDPACLNDPYAAVPEQVKLAWLSAVGEARSLFYVWITDRSHAVMQFGFVLTGLFAAGLMFWAAPQGQKVSRAALGVLLFISALATIWQIRGTTFSHVFAAMAAGWLFGYLFSGWHKRRGSTAALVLFIGTICVSPMTWKVLSQAFEQDPQVGAITLVDNSVCLNPAHYAALPDQPRMRVLSPIDLGNSVMVRSPHSVFAGPYHRNIQGIDRVTDLFLGATEQAHAKLVAIGADHLLYCRGLGETVRYARLRPEGFASDMEAGRVPAWLIPIGDIDNSEQAVVLYQILVD